MSRSIWRSFGGRRAQVAELARAGMAVGLGGCLLKRIRIRNMRNVMVHPAAAG